MRLTVLSFEPLIASAKAAFFRDMIANERVKRADSLDKEGGLVAIDSRKQFSGMRDQACEVRRQANANVRRQGMKEAHHRQSAGRCYRKTTVIVMPEPSNGGFDSQTLYGREGD